MLTTWTACYRLNGISISGDTSTYHVEQFTVQAPDAPPAIGQLFSERLKDRINSETRLTAVETDPHVEFSGSITAYAVTPEAPNANNRADMSRLTVAVSINYEDHLNPTNSYSSTLTDYELYDANINLLDVQDELLQDIYKRLIDDAFNKAFSNW